MTKEEIIEGLYHIKNWECNGNAKMHEVVVAAIKALEEESALYAMPTTRPFRSSDLIISVASGRYR